jgi:ATP-dependent Clp protease ATP-binding subunit ClpB
MLIFNPLTANEIKQIVEIQLQILAKRLEERKITIQLTDAAKEKLALEGFDPVYGARPIKRAIQREVLNPLAQEILKGDIRDGSKVSVDYKDGAFTFEPFYS